MSEEHLWTTAFELSKGCSYFHKIKNAAEAYSEYCQASNKMGLSSKILNGSQLLFTQLSAMPQKKKKKKLSNYQTK